VDADNKPARAFYRKLGFEELLTDMSEKRYDANGLYLTFVKAPKVLLRKVIN
jgi:ribosomal protein S18 acetylase RimI-like enzyme